MSDSLTICAKCRHFEREGDFWHGMYCGHPAAQLKEVIDVVTGETVYGGRNSLGDLYQTDEPRPHCRDINNGLCPHFDEAKKESP